MNPNERYVSLVKELINGVDAGDFDNIEAIPAKYTYEHLYSLFLFAGALDNGKMLYEQIYDIVVRHGKRSIYKKVRNGEKIKVAFLAISAAEWPASDLYHSLCQNERVECYIIVPPPW